MPPTVTQWASPGCQFDAKQTPPQVEIAITICNAAVMCKNSFNKVMDRQTWKDRLSFGRLGEWFRILSENIFFFCFQDRICILRIGGGKKQVDFKYSMNISIWHCLWFILWWKSTSVLTFAHLKGLWSTTEKWNMNKCACVLYGQLKKDIQLKSMHKCT